MATIRRRSIGSVQPTLRGGGRFDLSPYEKKIAELHNEISKEAKLLQDATEKKESELREIALLIERKGKIATLNFKLQGEIALSQEALETSIETKGKFLSESEKELRRRKEESKNLEKVISNLQDRAEEMKSVVAEVEAFVSNGVDAHQKWLEEQDKLNAVEKKHEKLMSEMNEKERFMREEKKSLDGMKDYLKDFYGKVATYVAVAKETIEQVNEALEKNTPIRFQLPPGEKELEIDFKDFNKYL